jgi:hypothetical protein
MDRNCAPFAPCRRPELVGGLVLTLLLAACTGPEPNVAVSPRSNVSEARRVLLLAAANGPVPLVVDRAPASLDGGDLTRVAGLAEEAVADFTRVDFVPESDPSQTERARLVLRFRALDTIEPARICSRDTDAATATAPATPARLQAVLCDGDRYIGDAAGIARSDTSEDTARLVTRTVSALFPPGSDYGGSYNLPGVSVFGGVGSGGSGVGVGLGF